VNPWWALIAGAGLGLAILYLLMQAFIGILDALLGWFSDRNP
jgi:4-amino-4-deoxy-L-arabinose transferase-like glycosyltransferase